MREFNYSIIRDKKWDSELLGLIAAIYKETGKQEMYLKQRPEELEKLVEIAKVQSTEASNAIEGIVTTNTRIRQLVEEKTTPKNRDEQEIAGYRDVSYNGQHRHASYVIVSFNTEAQQLQQPQDGEGYSETDNQGCQQNDSILGTYLAVELRLVNHLTLVGGSSQRDTVLLALLQKQQINPTSLLADDQFGSVHAPVRECY